MRSPKEMRVIQIDITNACVHQCSNCTRFCGHHRKNFFMDWETFQKAVRSLKDFDHCVGVMGGEPTLHPQFERFITYLAKQRQIDHQVISTRKPILNFPRYIRDKNYFVNECLNKYKGLGLWTSITEQYYRNFELIQDIFNYQSINDHNNPSLHQPLLASRKEMGIKDEEWISMRDACIIQNMWSASITPKGAFFCEVAAALDMLFDGPGGWPIEPGWWKREPNEFGYQLNWCEICGGALFHSGRLSSEEIDDVSPLMYEKLKRVDSPKVKAERVVVMDMNNPQPGKPMPNTKNRYLTNFNDRVSHANNVLFADKISAIVFCTDETNFEKNLSELQEQFDHIAVFTMESNIFSLLQENMKENPQVTVIPIQMNSFGRTLNKAIEKMGNNWICILNENMAVPKNIIERMKKVVLNPGVLYSLSSPEKITFFHPYAFALKKACYDGIAQCDSFDKFYFLWDKDNKVTLDENFDHLKNPDLDNWRSFVENQNSEDKASLLNVLQKIGKDYL